MTERSRRGPTRPPSRRDMLRAMGAAPIAVSALQASTAAQAQTSNSKAHIVIAGSGLGGIAVASRLRSRGSLQGADGDGRSAHGAQHVAAGWRARGPAVGAFGHGVSLVVG